MPTMPAAPPAAVSPRVLTRADEYAIDAGRRAFLPALQAATKAGRLAAVVSYHDDGRPDISTGLWRDCFFDYLRRLAEPGALAGTRPPGILADQRTPAGAAPSRDDAAGAPPA